MSSQPHRVTSGQSGRQRRYKSWIVTALTSLRFTELPPPPMKTPPETPYIASPTSIATSNSISINIIFTYRKKKKKGRKRGGKRRENKTKTNKKRLNNTSADTNDITTTTTNSNNNSMQHFSSYKQTPSTGQHTQHTRESGVESESPTETGWRGVGVSTKDTDKGRNTE